MCKQHKTELWISPLLCSYSCIVLQDKWRDIELLRLDAGEELLQIVEVADLFLHARYTESGEEPC